MPVYTIYHRSCIPSETRISVAERLTLLHSSVTGAGPELVKVMFVDLDSDSIFIGGARPATYIRAFAQIREGRTTIQKSEILYGMYEILRSAMPSGEIQTQTVEIDDTKTVMTNGKMNE